MDEQTKEIVASNLTIAYYVAEGPDHSEGIQEIVRVYMDILRALEEKLGSNEADYESISLEGS